MQTKETLFTRVTRCHVFSKDNTRLHSY